MHLHAPRYLAVPLLLAPLAACTGGGSPPPIDSTFDGARAWSNLQHIVSYGPRPSGSEALGLEIDWLEEQLTSFGLTPHREAFTEQTPAGEITFQNLYADIAGAGEGLPLVLLGGHIDTIRSVENFVGANDSGSSTAVLLELARGLAAIEGERKVDYRVVFFDGEEPQEPNHGRMDPWRDGDHTYGSEHHVEQLRARGEFDRTACLILLDMVGDQKLQLFSEVYSDQVLLRRFFEAARASGLRKYVGGPKKEIKDDHMPFLSAGIPSVNLIDLSYGGPANPLWHTSEDTLANCAPGSLNVAGHIVLYALPSIESWATDQKSGS